MCDKTIVIRSKSKHINSKFHKYKEKFGLVVKQYNFIKPDMDEVNYIFNETLGNAGRNIFIHLNIDV